MKPVAAIVEKPEIDVVLLDKQLAVALAGESEADRAAERYEKQALSARETAKIRRLEIGRILTRLRAAYPERGPNAKPWGELLAKHKMAESTARMYMDEFRDPNGFAEKRGRSAKPQPDPPDPDPGGDRDSKPANVSGGSGDVDRGTFCTSKLWAERVGPWDLDPFSNPRSHVVAERRCMLEDGGNGLLDLAVAGSYSAPPKLGRADETTRVWIQPPYERGFIERVIAHYGHTRFCALLRLDASTEWFAAVWERTRVIALAKGTREFFEAPPDVPVSTNPQPHALYYADPRDITPAIYETCIVLSRYEAQANPAALHIVR